ncbi:MAG: hypothetical protein JRM91_04260 [Nitrososphaerota archaeon]|nr:hypothetical protein [Nitrososphaerota archaeon]
MLIYSIHLGYAAAAFMSMSRIIWSFLSTRIAGVSSPVGLAHVLGVSPVLAVLLLSSAVSPGAFGLLTPTATVVLVVVVISMMITPNK